MARNYMTTAIATTNEITEFMQLKKDVRDEVQRWQGALEKVAPPIGQAVARIAQDFGVSVQTARRKYDAFKKHGWRGLINRAKAPEIGGNLSSDFLEYWKGLCLENKRKCAPAYRKFVRQFTAGEPIPGIPAGISRLSIPRGYSYDNLMLHKPTRFELTAARQGRSSAFLYRPKIYTTRVGMEVGQVYMYDDMWHDFEVVMFGQLHPMRPLQLHALDLFSACQFCRGLKPRMENPETGKRINLTDDEMFFLLLNVFSIYGYNPDGCINYAEMGTAKIDETTEQELFDLTNGIIRVERNGIQSAAAFSGQYDGRGKGNFRFKAALESLGNITHNETADALEFPGQTGSNARLNCPEELDGRKKHASSLALALLELPAEIREELRQPFLEWNRAKWLINDVMERINRRTVHNLEGWKEAGLTSIDYYLPDMGTVSGKTLLALPPEKQALVKALGTPKPRLLSPREVFDSGRKKLVKLTPVQLAMLMKSRAKYEVCIGNDHLITFQDSSIAPSPLRFAAPWMPPGEKYAAAVNPMNPSVIVLFDAAGKWMGNLNSWQTVPHLDNEKLKEQMGAASHMEKMLLAPLAQRGAKSIQQRLDDANHNSRVLDEYKKKGTPTERKAAVSAEKMDDELIRERGASALADMLKPLPKQPADRFGI